MKKIMIVLTALLLVLVGCSKEGGKDSDVSAKYKIGVIQLIEHGSLDASYDGMIAQLDKELGKDNYSVDYKNASGDQTVVEQVVSKFVNDKVDLIYAIATNAAQSAVNAVDGTDIPVVFNAVTDPVSAQLVDSMDQPGGNVTGVTDISPVKVQLEIVKEILPNAKKVGIVYNVGEVNSSYQIDLITKVAKELNIEIISKGVSDASEIPLVTKSLLDEVDALFNITDNMIVNATATLVGLANDVKKPVFASEDGQFDQGILAAESLSYFGLGEASGSIIKSILVDGKKPSDIPVVKSEVTTLYVNKDAASLISLELPQSVLNRATIR